MIEEYYYKPNLVPPFSFFVYIYWIIWILIVRRKTHKKTYPQGKDISRKKNLISNWINWTKDLNFYGKNLI